MDLTPYYGYEEDAQHFHQVCKNSLAPFDPALHPKFKQWCDEYFFLKHRNEPRGVGGIFFDDLSAPDFDTCFAIQQSVGDHYLSAYVPILEKRKDTPYGELERDFQLYRRGRYVEFNLVVDRGTIFGLQSNGRTESILLSMPPLVKWRYDWHPEEGTPEAELYDKFLVRALVFSFLDLTTINIYSQVGLITLVGLIAKNGILIVEFANTLQERGLAKMEALREASLTRLRPVLMTSAATVFGHMPLVFVTGPGSEARNSIGIVLVSGMIVGTMFTMFIVPVFYSLIAADHSPALAPAGAREEAGVRALEPVHA
jgi:hypothetical protein